MRVMAVGRKRVNVVVEGFLPHLTQGEKGSNWSLFPSFGFLFGSKE